MVEYLAPIDPHVHLRGEEYPNHNFFGLGFRNAQSVGLAAVLEQPNPKPWLIDSKTISERLIRAKLDTKIRYGIHIGLTNDLNQVENALEYVMDNNCGVVSDKVFYVHSTGNMGILDPDVQKKIWEIKTRLGYKGISIGHFEDENWFLSKFDPLHPVSHSKRQDPTAEINQVEAQIKNAYNFGFQGTFYIAHVSNPETVEFIERTRSKLPFDIVIEATFHHMFLNTLDYETHGNRVKVNPPLRNPGMQEKVLEYVLSGKIDIIGTDHAPHPIERKDSNEPPSGIPALPFWPRGIELLREDGIDELLLEDIIFNNANRVFKLNIKPRYVDVTYNPGLWGAYGYNPFLRVDK